MERIPRKERLRRVSAGKVNFFAVILFALLLVSFSIIYYNEHKERGVYIKKLEFLDEMNDVYVKFTINNPTSENKTCFLNLSVLNDSYQGYVNLTPESIKPYKVLVDMPEGKTDVRLDYTCGSYIKR